MPPRLIDVRHKQGFDPTLFDGHLHIPSYFTRYFPFNRKSLEEIFNETAHFLESNGYTRPRFEDTTDEMCWRYEDYSFYADLYSNSENKQIVINIPIMKGEEKQIDVLIERLRKFTQERDWSQFHNPKDLALAINIEAGELLELFLWKKAEDAKKDRVKEELADVLTFCLLLADNYDFDVEEIIKEKISRNAEKYPVEKSKGVATKYNEL